ncbi:hypothetical protein EON80_19095 [bacterium]|nr:MAG: hypothetical protein EON80_19095 [bacterium]
MKWGNLNNLYVGVMMKRLSAHEVDPKTSRQHEFQGVKRMIDLLGGEKREDIPTCYRFFLDHGEVPVVGSVIKAASTWYDTRENDPKRPAEWRLYFKTNAVWDVCEPGDLLVVALRSDSSLDLYFAPSGSVAELMLLEAFGATAHRFLEQAALDELLREKRQKQEGFQPATQIVSDLPRVESVEQLSLVLSMDEDSLELSADLAKAVDPAPEALADSDSYVDRVARLYLDKWPGEKLGTSREVADALISVVDLESAEGVDVALTSWLEIGEAAYWVWEKSVCVRFLNPLRWDKSISDEQLADQYGKRWMSFRQSRVSRAGGVMECLLETIFRRNGLLFDTKAAAKVDGGKLPDFLFPNGASYRNPAFPTDKLRILGSKTSFKDRWPQILDEGRRVARKHGVTRDTKITKSMFSQMDSKGFTVVMPEPIIHRYGERPANLMNLRAFMDEILELQKVF